MTMTKTKTYKKTNTKTKTHTHRHKDNTKCFQDPLYAICIKISGFKDLKYYIGRNGPKMHFWSISEPPGGPWGQFWCVQMAPTDHLRCIPPRSNQDPLRSSHLEPPEPLMAINARFMAFLGHFWPPWRPPGTISVGPNSPNRPSWIYPTQIQPSDRIS